MTSPSRDLLDFMVTAWFVLVRIIPAGPEGPKRCIPGGLGQRECHGTRRSGHLWSMVQWLVVADVRQYVDSSKALQF